MPLVKINLSALSVVSFIAFAMLGISTFPSQALAENIQTIQVPKGQLNLTSNNLNSVQQPLFQLEFHSSNWAPQAFREISNLKETTEYTGGRTPSVTINMRTQGWDLEHVKLAPKFGVSYRQIQRTARMPILDPSLKQTVEVSEDANLFTGRMGLEVSPQLFLYGQLQPSAGISFAPTWVQIASSEMTEGVGRMAMTWEQNVVITWWSTRLAKWTHVQDFGFEMGFENTSRLSEIAPAGSGVLVGIRLEL